MQVQNRMLVPRIVWVGFLIASAVLVVSPAAAEDWETCISSLRSDVAIAACTRAIASGQYTTQNLATLYTSRGLAYLATNQLDQAAQDFDQAFRVDPQFEQDDRANPVPVGDGGFILCCRAMLLDNRVKVTWAIKDIWGNADDQRCITACFKKLNSSHF